jgi:hypothetical protein
LMPCAVASKIFAGLSEVEKGGIAKCIPPHSARQEERISRIVVRGH